MSVMKCIKNGEKGYKWGETGVCFIGSEAKQKAAEVGKAVHAQSKDSNILNVHDTAIALQGKIDNTTGFLTAPVVLARTGVQYYLGFELGIQDRMTEMIGVLRPSEEVFNEKSIKSFTNLPVCDDHPNGVVTIENIKDLQCGSVSYVEPEKNILKGIITITDKEQIKKAKDGKLEVSVGYSNGLVPEIGVFNGDKYEFKQTKIKANHLAIVDAGRCGSACKIITDSQKKEIEMVEITIDGITYSVEDSQLAQAVTKLQAAQDEEKTALQKKLDQEKEEKKKAIKEKDEAEAKKEVMEKEKTSDEDIAKLVADKAALLAQIKEVLGDAMPKCTDCDTELKTLVIEKVLSDMDLKEKSDDYINAAYDMAVTKFEKGKKSTENLKGDFSVDSKDLIKTRNDARAKYIKDTLKIEEG